MKIVWAGWPGPSMNDASVGLETIDPNIKFIEVGHHYEAAEDDFKAYHPSQTKLRYTSVENLHKMLAEADVVIHNSYIFSQGHRPEIFSYLPGAGCITQFPWWNSLKATKILLNDEGPAGQQEWYDSVAKHFDVVVDLPPIVPLSILFRHGGNHRHIDVMYTGDNLHLGYRRNITDTICNMDTNWLVAGKRAMSIVTWTDALRDTKIYIATSSCASGDKEPMNPKNKEFKALLCGAMPITEDYTEGNQNLEPGKEKVTFSSMNELRNAITYYLEHEDERLAIAEAGRARVIRDHSSTTYWDNLFRRLKLL